MAEHDGKTHHHGRGKDLHEACMDAYKVARAAGEEPPFVVAEIHLEGRNPFDNYLVKLARGPRA